jgi:YhcN/YlaJ family sporulation lipoprotein
LRIIVLVFLTFFLACSFGCARYKSQAPVQEQNMLPTRYQINTNENNPSYNKNANFITQKNQITGVRVSNEVARSIIDSYQGVESATVVIIKNRAYVAVVIHPKYKSLGNLRFQIPALVKNMQPTVDKVYVSDNPNFRRMLEKYQK